MSTQQKPASVRTSSPKRPTQKRFDWLPILLTAPAAVLMGVLLFVPISRAIHLSFFKVKLLQLASGGTFVGFQNYSKLFKDPFFWNSLRVTVLYSLGVVTAAYLLGLGLALLLNQKFPARGVMRTLIIIPWAVPEVVAVLIFIWMLDAQYGILNFFLLKTGLIKAPMAWLVDANLALPAVVMVTVWKQFPLALLILLAGLQTIPDDHYEAARIDGANSWQRFRYITMPGLRPVNIVLILILILYSFRRVTLIYTMTAGGPARSTETLSILTYNTAFQYQKLGYATTVGTVLLLLLLIFTLFYFMLVSRRGDYT
jgi:multiple sugar transport system permease protein